MALFAALRTMKSIAARTVVMLALVLFACGPSIDNLMCGDEHVATASAASDHPIADDAGGGDHGPSAPSDHGPCAHGHCHHGAAFALTGTTAPAPYLTSARVDLPLRTGGPLSFSQASPDRPPRA